MAVLLGNSKRKKEPCEPEFKKIFLRILNKMFMDLKTSMKKDVYHKRPWMFNVYSKIVQHILQKCSMRIFKNQSLHIFIFVLKNVYHIIQMFNAYSKIVQHIYL